MPKFLDFPGADCLAASIDNAKAHDHSSCKLKTGINHEKRGQQSKLLRIRNFVYQPETSIASMVDPSAVFCIICVVCALSLEGVGRELLQAWKGARAETCRTVDGKLQIVDPSSEIAEAFRCYIVRGVASRNAPDIGLQLFAFSVFFSLTIGVPIIVLLVHNELIHLSLTHWFRHAPHAAIGIVNIARRSQQFFAVEIVLCLRCIMHTEGYVRYCWIFLLLKTLMCLFPSDIVWCAIGTPLARIIGAVYFPFMFGATYAITRLFLPFPLEPSIFTLCIFPVTIAHSWGSWKALVLALKKNNAAQFTPSRIFVAPQTFGAGPRLYFEREIQALLALTYRLDRRFIVLGGFVAPALLHQHTPTLLWCLSCLPWILISSNARTMRAVTLSVSVLTMIHFFTTHPFTVVGRGKVGQLKTFAIPWAIQDMRWLIGPMLVAMWTTRGIHRELERFFGMAQRWSWRVIFWVVLVCSILLLDPVLVAVILQIDRFGLDGNDIWSELGITDVARTGFSTLPTADIIVASRLAVTWTVIQAVTCCSYWMAALYLLAGRALWSWVR